MRLYHGGVRYLQPGDRILPPSQTGKRSLADYGAGRVCRRDRVYLTNDLEAAMVFAAFWTNGEVTGGAVYDVEVAEALLEPDPDCTVHGMSWQAPEATVVRVVRGRVRWSDKERRRAIAVILA